MLRNPLILAAAAVVALGAPAFAQETSAPRPSPLRQMDLNADGQVTRPEVDAALRTGFAEADLNDDGRLTREEFTAHAEARRAAHAAQRPQGAPDGQADGRREDRHGPHDPAEAFARADWNQDGFVNLDEFATQPRMMAQRADQNADGVIAGDELDHRGRHGRGEGRRGEGGGREGGGREGGGRG